MGRIKLHKAGGLDMKRTTLAWLLLVGLATTPAVAHDPTPTPMSDPTSVAGPIPILEGWQSYDFPIRTANEEAQRYFNQGVLMLHGFNHADAIRSFERAVELDPTAAMPHWGIAYALGMNINWPADDARQHRARHEIEQALTLSEGGPARERAYIEALAVRYPAEGGDPAANELAYNAAMRELFERYPDDVDAATFYAESSLNLNPWAWWDGDQAAEGVEEAIAALEGALRRVPDHPGANHLYIHAVEASPDPWRALEAARQLDGRVPASGHLVHMSSHVYLVTGRHEQAAESNIRAVEGDREHFDLANSHGLYPAFYYLHNLHMQTQADMLQGQYGRAKEVGLKLLEEAEARSPEVEMISRWIVDYFGVTPILVDARFGRWDAVLATEAPAEDLPITRGLWHHARGMAHAARGDIEAAWAERDALAEAIASLPPGYPYGQSPGDAVLQIALHVLDGRTAMAQGDFPAAISSFEQALAAHDTQIIYSEPPDWYYPVRESLGAALLADGQAAEAEAVFRADVSDYTPRNPRSLFGLAHALEAQGRHEEAGVVYRQFEQSWSGEIELELTDL
jgi:tetratricopeptide (TPR) repeat protein